MHTILSQLLQQNRTRRTGFQEGLSPGPCLALLLLSAERLQKLGIWILRNFEEALSWLPGCAGEPLGPSLLDFLGDNWVAACWIALGDRWVLHISFSY